MPARTRSTIKLRSSSAMAPMMTTMARPSGPAARVDLLAEADELDAEPVQLIEHFQEVPGGAGDAIAGPDQHDIEAAAAGVPHQIVETRAPRLHAADLVGVFMGDFKAPLGSQLTQIEELGFRMLVNS